MSQRLLITGAAGFLGRNICEVLAPDYTIRGLDVAPCAEGVESLVGSVTDDALLKRACEGIDALVIAHMLPSRPPENYARVAAAFDVNVKGTAMLFETAVDAGIRRVVLVSSISVVNRQNAAGEYLHAGLPTMPDSTYSLTKALQEEVARYYHFQYGVEIAVLRPAYIAREDSLADKYGIQRPTVNWQFTDLATSGGPSDARCRFPAWAMKHSLSPADLAPIPMPMSIGRGNASDGLLFTTLANIPSITRT